MNRDEKQIAVIEQYIREGSDRCTLELSTGFGKSRIAIEVLKHLRPDNVLILVNSTDLRDNTWEKEFINFNFHDYFKESVELVTYQLAYKWTRETRDLNGYFIVADEVDFAADVPALSNFFYEYSDSIILGLTGFITSSKREWFETHLPILATLSQDDAQEANILNNIHFVFVKYELSKDPNSVEITYTKNGEEKSFKQSENKAYDYQHARVIKYIVAKESLYQNLIAGKIDYDKYNRDIGSLDYLIQNAIRERSELLLNSPSSAEISRKLIGYLQRQDPDNKIVVFSKRTAQSELIVGKDHIYNGKLNKKTATKRFQDFQTSKIKLLGVCDKINRGVNIDNLNVGIFESFYGSDTQAIQRFGRLMRLSPDQLATVYILLPYFIRTTKSEKQPYKLSETQQVNWAVKMLRSTNVKSKEVWDYRTSVKQET